MSDDWWDAMQTEAIGWALIVLVVTGMVVGGWLWAYLKTKRFNAFRFRNWRL